jgi:hypothetical protein
MQRTGTFGRGQSAADGAKISRTNTLSANGNGAGVVGSDIDGPTTVMGNKWQESGAWAVDGRGSVVWGMKAIRADDVPDLDFGLRALGV